MIRSNPVKVRLAAGQKCLGLWLAANSGMTAEIVAQAGVDFVIIDHEHGPGDLMGAAAQMQALRSGSIGAANDDGREPGGPAVILRVPWNDTPYIKRALDTGAEGIMVPYVETAAEAEAAVRACKYPPAGNRGCAVSAIRAAGFGHASAEYWDRINDEVCTVLQIETQKGIANIPEIARVEGVDVLFIGPTDMTATSGFNPTAPTAESRAIVESAESAVKAARKPMAAVPYGGQSAAQMFDRGFDLVAAGSDLSLIRAGANAAMAAHRGRWG